MDRNITEEFQASTKFGIVTGSLKFSNKFCSQIQIYEATRKWEDEDKGLIFASIRTDGDDFIALDFRYDESVRNGKHKSILYDFLKPLFEKKLGEDYVQAWSVSRESVVVK